MATARVAGAMAMGTKMAIARKREMVRVVRVMEMAIMVVGNKEGKGGRKMRL
jgi:hypothetical protein